MPINKVLIEGELCSLPSPVKGFEESLSLIKVISTDSMLTPNGVQLLTITHDIIIPVRQASKLSQLRCQVYIEGSLLDATLLASYGLAANVIWGKTLHNLDTQKYSIANGY